MSVIINAVSSQAGELKEKNPLDLFLDLGKRINTKHDDYWSRYLKAMVDLSKGRQLFNLHQATGAVKHSDLRRLINVFFRYDAYTALGLQLGAGMEIEKIPYSFDQIEKAANAKLMLTYFPMTNLKSIEPTSSKLQISNSSWQCDKNSFYYTHRNSGGYYFVGVSGESSFDGNYYEQTDKLATWLDKHIELSNEPDFVWKAIKQFRSFSGEKTAKSLSTLHIQFYRENAVEYIVRLLIQEKTNLPYDIGNACILTSDAHNGKIVGVHTRKNRITIALKPVTESAPGWIRCLPKIF